MYSTKGAAAIRLRPSGTYLGAKVFLRLQGPLRSLLCALAALTACAMGYLSRPRIVQRPIVLLSFVTWVTSNQIGPGAGPQCPPITSMM